VVTLDKLEQHEQRDDRTQEYQYRFIRIIESDDPIFENIQSGDPKTPARILRVWQNHGLQLDRLPDGFQLLATSYLCRNQMMVKRSEGQLIYTVQFHLEKSFEDWNKNRTRWEHPNDSRDGRILFENFLTLATS
jgi:GMP synthase-like glutamine amidotransferase